VFEKAQSALITLANHSSSFPNVSLARLRLRLPTPTPPLCQRPPGLSFESARLMGMQMVASSDTCLPAWRPCAQSMAAPLDGPVLLRRLQLLELARCRFFGGL
jgi:hypothetical protein